ncbi:MAG: Uma2 family endonuclease [Chroococcidiopsidaceae cyanobacterium CP_BM_RX_35]|nr:Uma2 family endonuclease [Chroococcidiopsidaceae cyanobacterium CP_BM_RX_35]
MTQPITEPFRWTTKDLELLPDNGDRYEIIDGELFVTRAPHWDHQEICGRVFAALDAWSFSTGSGRAAIAPGIIFSEADNVIPDVVWASHQRLAVLLDDAGHLIAAPELVAEVISPGPQNQRRDRDLKLRLYSARGVQEYWLIDYSAKQLEVYRRDGASLRLVATLFSQDELTSPLLPSFSFPLARLFS